MVDPMHSDDIKQSEIISALFAEVPRILDKAAYREELQALLDDPAYRRGLLALLDELQQQGITPVELAATLNNYRQANIYVEDLSRLACMVTHPKGEYGIIGFQIARGNVRDLDQQYSERQPLPSQLTRNRRKR